MKQSFPTARNPTATIVRAEATDWRGAVQSTYRRHGAAQ